MVAGLYPLGTKIICTKCKNQTIQQCQLNLLFAFVGWNTCPHSPSLSLLNTIISPSIPAGSIGITIDSVKLCICIHQRRVMLKVSERKVEQCHPNTSTVPTDPLQ